LYVSYFITVVKKLRRVKWRGHGNTRDRDFQLYKISVWKPKVYFQMGETDVKKRIILI